VVADQNSGYDVLGPIAPIAPATLIPGVDRLEELSSPPLGGFR